MSLWSNQELSAPTFLMIPPSGTHLAALRTTIILPEMLADERHNWQASKGVIPIVVQQPYCRQSAIPSHPLPFASAQTLSAGRGRALNRLLSSSIPGNVCRIVLASPTRNRAFADSCLLLRDSSMGRILLCLNCRDICVDREADSR